MFDKLTKAITGTTISEALDQSKAMTNADGTTNPEALAASQDQMRQQLERTKNSTLGKMMMGSKRIEMFQQMSEDAFKRQNAMVNHMNAGASAHASDHAAPGVDAPLPPAAPVRHEE